MHGSPSGFADPPPGGAAMTGPFGHGYGLNFP
jgi:hypothetical protein